MPPKRMNMVISNGNFAQNLARSQINIANLAGAPGSTAVAAVTAPSSLNAPILARVHNVRPGCGSCGRH